LPPAIIYIFNVLRAAPRSLRMTGWFEIGAINENLKWLISYGKIRVVFPSGIWYAKQNGRECHEKDV
jgi:hypothetical protein